ncbi:mitochondrial chaperone BCS1 [Trifolium pratense]|uniref:Mitochondrial chaperone BCS1 n=1 Tax=Trifolium pratense TaxID=57577 RepID=A0A2K3L030_TRIPR|nr:mitochondrial chaperone BCS1 [Trifolium pratense]
MTPADVAESLMPKSVTDDYETCFKTLIQSLEIAKEKEEDEAKKNAEKDEQELAQEDEKV